MATVIRSEVSKKNEYYISKHRYYELKHFCMQYKDFKRIYNDLCSYVKGGIVNIEKRDGAYPNDESMYVRERYLDNITLIETCCKLTDEDLWQYILQGVTEGLPYSYLRINYGIPCCKDIYYKLYRKFFYILSNKKD